MASNLYVCTKAQMTIHQQSGTEDTFYLSWSHNNLTNISSKYIDGILVRCYELIHDTAGNEKWIPKTSWTTLTKNAMVWNETHTISANAYGIQYAIRPKRTSDGKKKYKSNIRYKDQRVTTPDQPSDPSAPTASFTSTYTVQLNTSTNDTKAYEALFRLYYYLDDEEENRAEYAKSDWKVLSSAGATKTATWSSNIVANQAYEATVQYRSSNGTTSNESPTAEVSGSVVPGMVQNFTPTILSSSRIRFTWTAASGAATTNGYQIEYAKSKELFGTSSISGSVTVTGTSYETDIETGNTWWFRIRAVNENGVPGEWTEPISATMALKPYAPTTWTLSNTAMVSSSINLYWTYNTADGSKLTETTISYNVNGGTEYTKTITHSLGDDDIETTFFETFNLQSLPTSGIAMGDGDILYWKVKCKGISATYSDFSTTRTVTAYSPGSLSISTTQSGIYTSYPLPVTINVQPNTQNVTSLSVMITALNSYTIESDYGEPTVVNAGDVVYSKVFTSTGHTLTLSLTPYDVRLSDTCSYMIQAYAAMSTGLTAYNSANVTLLLADESFSAAGNLTLDQENKVAIIQPLCYTPNTETLYSGVTLGVSRINKDGSFTKLYSGLDNTGTALVIDPYPSLSNPTYRVVATSNASGDMDYIDLDLEGFDKKGIVIQWDMDYLPLQSTNTGYISEMVTGSLLELPYNVKIQESNEYDSELISYIGRKNPVSYYGTQTGFSGSWSADIPKTDTKTLRLLRELQVYPGDVYVREPSGTGYWANIAVSFDISYDNSSPAIPVTLDLKRVDGGE